jgi:ubiquinone/menaquinone biosynthesis C-methylase UbiE
MSMSDVEPAIGATVSGNPASAVFEREWRTYRKMVDNNYLFHREAYACLREIVTSELARPFRFLDIACGDASATVGALTGTSITHYRGIDLSGDALEIAAQNLTRLDCTVELHRGDFEELLARRQGSVDVVWVGLSLHHLDTARKLAAMRHIRRIVDDRGLFLAYENASPDGEDRSGWLRRWDGQEPYWTAYSDDEWRTMTGHVHVNDIPETSASWHALGRQSGFREVKEVFIAPSDLFRMYLFRP